MTTGASQLPRPPRPRRSRARTLVPLGIAAWLVLEIWLLTLVADAAGGLTVFLLLVVGVVLGAVVVKRAGRRAWRSLTGRARAGEQAGPGGGNTLPMLGGLLLMLPGLASDAAALVCLFPPTRALLHRRAERFVERRVGAMGAGGPDLGNLFQQARMHRPDGKVVPGEVVRDDEPHPGRPHRDDPQLPG
ncbi:FxsA family membrane protein [Streptomyces pactum]|uniref:FxsA family membrane protein n=1 Tax=Streptomyces pactum TaxID=68249 RepID=UPI0036F651C1